MPLLKRSFGHATDGQEIQIYTLKNSQGIEVEVITFGAIIRAIRIRNVSGSCKNVVLSHDHLIDYERDTDFHGAIIGRYSNRIANGRFKLNGKEYILEPNENHHTLHGGPNGFHKKVWRITDTINSEDPSLTLSCYSPDMESGFPGNLRADVKYQLTGKNQLIIELRASCDRDTVVNMTSHPYFNLLGDFSSSIAGHMISINANYFTPINSDCIPTGEIIDVQGTPFDLRNQIAIGSAIYQEHEQLILAKGFDHNWVLAKTTNELTLAASAYCDESGINLNVYTTQKGIQFYTGNNLSGKFKMGSGFCLEPQSFPDSPNHRQFPDVVLKKGNEYRETIIYEFSTQ